LKSLIICCFTVFLLCLTCSKKTQITDNENTTKTEINNIKYIRDFILNDLNLKWNYPNLEDFLNSLNITENYAINEEYFNNPYSKNADDYICIYTIEYGQYILKIIYSTTNAKIYFLLSNEIEIDDGNYLYLFPYIEKYKYLSNNDFGEINPYNKKEENIISYVIKQIESRDIEGYCDLIFENNLLKSINIIAYVP
jgi:hypothetical protein